ncbi:MAG: tRNA (adenosine(37)-N6)-dimethylallyltransferase MiaA [Microbacterium sp.]|nr:tRNA (adenosine(37)-N6)-dimethylallyltransferase MiaA [Microbacterium sp.]
MSGTPPTRGGAGDAQHAEAGATETPRLWAVIGATGTGKTDLSLRLVEELRRRGRAAEIVNADAMQLYRGMDIGTAKLAPNQRRGIAHHMLDVLDVTEDAAVAWYQRDARAAIDDINSRGADAVLVGGSGLYVSSVLYDFRFPPRDERTRAELEADLDRDGPGVLFARLRERDPETARRIDPRNGRRLVRALEVLAQGEATHGASLPEAPVLAHAASRLIGVEVPRDVLVPRLDRRVEQMWAAGLLDEVSGLRGRGLEGGVTARRAIGYAQALAQLEGELSEAEAIAATQALTRRYARRQVSWFRRYGDVRWVSPDVDVATLMAE